MSELEEFLKWLELQALIIGEPRIEAGRWEFKYDELDPAEVLARFRESKSKVDCEQV